MDRQLALVGGLTDDELEERLLRLARGERQVLVVFLAHLAEFDRRRAHEARSLPSLFEYCTRRLGLSEGEAYSRIRAARAGTRFPRVLEMLACGELHLSSVVRLAPHLTPDNVDSLLDRARGATKRVVERIAAEFETDAPHLEIIRALPGPDEAAPQERLVRIAFTATEALLAHLDRARALLRHKYPAGRLEDLFTEALEALLDDRDPDRKAAKKAARKRSSLSAAAHPASHRTRRIPQRVKDEVWRRDGGRCAFVSADGCRCGSAEWLEFDHIIPWALGGSSDDARNVRLLCRAHNQHARRQVFGGD
ncbi:MAG TPA: hypothetical protein DD417_02995 [Elusimicrobia bacterium]|nr:hypothetical protein [Elusimicrobiota bacterium]